MRIFHLYRSTIRQLEYYHIYKSLKEFKKGCHDFYLLQMLHYLENGDCDEVIIWRLQPPKKQHDIIFDINGKKFIQKFASSFHECFKYPKPELSFFRGGFKEYCNVTKQNPKFFGLKLYLGAGQRIAPQYGGVYDKILVESNEDLHRISNSIPFYKTCNPNIFFPSETEIKYQICYPSNFTQIRYKGQKFVLRRIGESKFLKKLKIVHLGNQHGLGKRLSHQTNAQNVEFFGWKERPIVNQILNESRFGLVASNQKDGCPRIITEILCSGTPLLIRDTTRLLDYYKEKGCIVYNDKNFNKVIKRAINNYDQYKKDAMDNLPRLSMEKICEMNLNIWKKDT